jgi:thiamine-phosphate pyrophosphorylase
LKNSDRESVRQALALYAVTDRRWLALADVSIATCESTGQKYESVLFQQAQQLVERTERAIRGGVTMVQLREKNINKLSYITIAKRMKEMCDKHNVLLIIDDDCDVAVASCADGVHVGQSDGDVCIIRKKIDDADTYSGKGSQRKILGVSVQTVGQAWYAEKNGADYLGVGAMFPTGTKSDADAVSIETLKKICAAVSIPVVAIGGITAVNASQLAGTGVAGVAVVSALYAADDAESAAKAIAKACRICGITAIA